MTYSEFEPTIQRLRAVYGDKAFPRERVEVVYRAVKFAPLDVWLETLNELIGESMHAPPLSKIRETLNIVRKRYGTTDDGWDWLRAEIKRCESIEPICPKCHNTGVLECYKKQDPHQYRYCMACDCNIGDGAIWLPENKGKIRQWRECDDDAWSIVGYSDVPPPRRATREEARQVSIEMIKSSDLNRAIGDAPAPRRHYESDKWDPNL